MKNTIRCCISCILPCGALDVIRIVHANGRVEEISGTVTASEIMKAYPKHVLKKPSSSASDDGMVPRIVVVPPDAELQRGKIYFLIPVPSSASSEKAKSRSSLKKKRRENNNNNNNNDNNNSSSSSNDGRSKSRSRSSSSGGKSDGIVTAAAAANLMVSDQYLSEIMSENKVSTQRERRRGRVGVWRPHLESISEAPNDERLN